MRRAVELSLGAHDSDGGAVAIMGHPAFGLGRPNCGVLAVRFGVQFLPFAAKIDVLGADTFVWGGWVGSLRGGKVRLLF